MPFNPELYDRINEIKAALERVASAHARDLPQDPEDFVVLRGSLEQAIEIAENPAKHVAMHKLVYASDATRERADAIANPDNLERCIVCNRPVRTGGLWVHMSYQGNLYPVGIDCEQAESMPEGSMYMFAIGPDCAKKIPVHYIHKKEG